MFYTFLLEVFCMLLTNDNKYNAQIVKERVKQLQKQKGIKNSDEMMEELEINVNAIRQMSDKKGIGCFALAKIADRLETTTDYLLGRIDKPDMTINVNQTGRTIVSSPINAVNNAEKPSNEMTAELVKIFEAMSFSDKIKIMNFVLELKTKTSPISGEE